MLKPTASEFKPGAKPFVPSTAATSIAPPTA